jgi:hypothetical protein
VIPGSPASAGRLCQSLLIHSILAGRRREELEADASADADRALARDLSALALGTTASGDAADRRLCEFLGRELGRHGPDVHASFGGLLSFGVQSWADGDHACGLRLMRSLLTMVPMREGHRHLYLCERCGVVGNVPAGAPLPGMRIGRDGALSVRFEAEPAPGWFTVCPQPVGGQPERPSLVQRLSGKRIERDVSIELAPGLRRWAVAIVTAGDYLVIQAPVPPR